MKKIELYEAYGCLEGQGGEPNWYAIGLFTNEADALKAAEGRYVGWAGKKDGKVVPKTINVFESYEDYVNKNRESALKSAQKKLTKEEFDAIKSM